MEKKSDIRGKGLYQSEKQQPEENKKKETREEKLAARLRENLHRRKAQQRIRKGT